MFEDYFNSPAFQQALAKASSQYSSPAMPRYAAGGQVMDDMEFSDYGLGGPMTGAEVVGVELANPMYGGPEQGGSYTGGIGGGSSRTEADRQQAILDVNPYVAPTEDMNLNPITSQRNSGQTGYYFSNELGLPARSGEAGMPGFVPVNPNATYRLVNGGTDGKVVYSGTGEDGLRNVFQQANQLTMDNPKNAYWGVEVLNPDTGQYDRVAENQGPNGLGIIGDIAGIALPIAAAIATGGASLGIQIAAGAAAGGLGGFLSGKDIVKSAIIGGVTAGIGNASGFNDAVGGVIGKAGNALGIGANAAVKEGVKQAAAEGAEQIVVTGLSNALQGAGSGVLQGITSAASNNLGGLTGYRTPAEQFAQQPSSIADPTIPYDGINVIGSELVSGSGSPFAAAVPVPVEAILSGTLNPAQPTPTEQATTEETVAEEPEDIVVTAYRPINAVGGFDPTSVSRETGLPDGSVVAALNGIGDLPMDPTLTELPPEETSGIGDLFTDGVVNRIADLENMPGDIVVTGNRTEPVAINVAPALSLVTETLPALTPDSSLTRPSTLDRVRDAADVVSTATTVIPLVTGAVGGGGSGGGTRTTDTTGLNFTTNPLRPTLTGGGSGGIGGGSGGIGGTANRYPYTPQTYGRAGGDQETEYVFFTRDPVTGAITAAPSASVNPNTIPVVKEGGEISDDMVKHLVDYHKNGGHNGPGKVKGIGSGQEDKIPAYLSDGEYVWSAQDVSDLGDGSNDEGVRRLDEMRKMVRQQAGRKDVKKIAKPQKGIDRMLKAVGGMA